LADLDPGNLPIRARLAEMLLKEGLRKETVDELLKVASGCVQIGQLPEAEKFYGKVLQIEPESLKARLGLGQIYYRSGDFSNAIAQTSELFDSGQADLETMSWLGDSYLKTHQLAKAEQVFSRILETDPQNREAKAISGRLKLQTGKTEEGYLILDELVEEYLQRNEVGKGLELLNEVKEEDPGFLRVRRRLADIYHKVGNEAGARQEQKEIADILLQQNNWEEARNVYLSILQADPNDKEVKARLEELEDRLRQPEPEPSPMAEVLPAPEAEVLAGAEPFEAPAEVSEIAIGERPASLEEALVEPELEEVPLLPAGLLAEEGVAEGDLAHEVEERLVEAEVYLKYGLVDKAVDYLKRIVEISPENIKAHQRLKEIYLDRRDREATIAQSLALADIYEREGQTDQAAAEADLILSLDPEHEIGKRRLPEVAAEPSVSLAEEVFASTLEQIPMGEEAGEEPIALETSLEVVAPSAELEVLEEAGAGLVLEQPIQEEELPEGLEGFLEELEGEKPTEHAESISLVEEAGLVAGVEEELAEAEFYAQHQMMEEAKSVYLRILRVDPENKIAQERLAQMEPQVVLEEAPEAEAASEAAEEEPELEIMEPEPTEVLEEVGAPMSAVGPLTQPMGEPEVADQEAELPPSVAAFPEVPLIKEITPVFKVAPATSVSPEEMFVDFAAELEKELERDAEAQHKALEELARSEMAPPTLNEILQEFRKGVRQTLEEKDFRTHYDLGIAYKDMDLLEEAIEEFRLASKDPSLLFDCCQLIGMCYLKTGAVDLAIEEFLKGLSIPNQRPEQYRGLKYELASAYEISGEVENAISLYTEIFEEDPSFREVSPKLKSLSMSQRQAAEGKEAAPPAPEEPEPSKGETTEEPTKPPAPKRRPRKVDYI
jgi:tetratricopeptide (TPR) repeat protein